MDDIHQGRLPSKLFFSVVGLQWLQKADDNLQFEPSGTSIETLCVDMVAPYHIARLDPIRGRWLTFIRGVCRWFPRCIQHHIRMIRPIWLLDDAIVVKVLRPGPRQELDFKREYRNYARLGPLQGNIIPVLHGFCAYHGKPSMVLS